MRVTGIAVQTPDTPIVEPGKAQPDGPRLLVVTPFAPDAQHGGGVCVRQMFADYPADKLIWMHHGPLVTDAASPWSLVRQWSFELLRRPNRFGLHQVKEYGNWTRHAARIARAAASMARAAGVEAVLGVGPGVAVRTSHLIAERMGVPLHLWIHDDPAAYAAYRRQAKFVQRCADRCFVEAYQAAAVRYTISAPMAEHYRQRTGCDAVVLPPSLGAWPCHPVWPRGEGRLRIGVAGSLVASAEWLVFLDAMMRLYADAPVAQQPEITVFAEPETVPVPPRIRKLGWVHVRGWQPTEAMDQALATMDFLYVPMWFDPARRLYVATSFSTKFVGYLRAGVPILCHVPASSAVGVFVGDCAVGPLLDTTDAEALAGRLRAVFNDEDWPARCAEPLRRARAQFDHATLQRRLCESLRQAAMPA